MNSTYQKLESASNDEVKRMHGQLFQKIKHLEQERRLVLEELNERHGIADDPDEELDVLQ